MVKDLYFGGLFIMNADWDKYGGLHSHWKLEFPAEHNMYPSDLQDEYICLETYKTPPKSTSHNWNGNK